MEKGRFDLDSYWGRLVALPCLFLVFAANLLGANWSATDLGLGTNVIGLIIVLSSTIMVTWKYARGHEHLFRIVFVLSSVLMQAFLGSALHDWMVMEDMADLMDDLSFVFILPSLLIAAQLWGWIFDRTRNGST